MHGGWREATEVPFYGLGDTRADNRVSYGFKQPYVSGLLTLKPTRKLLVVSGGIEYTQWKLQPGEDPSRRSTIFSTPGDWQALARRSTTCTRRLELGSIGVRRRSMCAAAGITGSP